jgi:hypothetical protein
VEALLFTGKLTGRYSQRFFSAIHCPDYPPVSAFFSSENSE